MPAVKQVGGLRVALVVLVAVAFGFGLGLAQSTRASAATTTTVTVASGSPAVIVSGLSKGDVVDVQATLSTSDPAEIGEGGEAPEALFLQSTGGFSWSFQVYGQPRAMRFLATVDGESLSGFIQGFDDDESASVTVTVNSTAQQFFSQQTKDLLDKVAGSEAIQVTQGRVQSAVDAGDDGAALQQQIALQDQINKYTQAIALVSSLQKEMAATLDTVVVNIGGLRIRTGFAAQAETQDRLFSQTITPDDVFNFENDVASNGLPDPIRETLAQIGATGDDIDTIRQLAMVQDPQAAAGEYPARIGEPALAADLRALAASLHADLPLDIAHLIGQVKERKLARGTENSLLTKLAGAQHNLDAGDHGGACRRLATFINEVQAQSAKKIDDAQALIDEATVLRESEGCGAA